MFPLSDVLDIPESSHLFIVKCLENARGYASSNDSRKIAIFLGSVVVADDEQSFPSRTDKACPAV
jgi:hypothetical protein